MTDIHDDDCICEQEVKKVPKKKDIPKSILQRSIYDKSLIPPSQIAKTTSKATPKATPKAIVSRCKSVQPFKLEDMEIEKVLVEYRIKGTPKVSSNIPRIESKRPMEAPKRLSVCEGLKLSGFSADWSKEKVAKLMNTPDGALLLKNVDKQYRELTGKSSLSEKDIISCYPNYLKKEKRNVELLVELDSDENILSVSEKNVTKKPVTKKSIKSKSKFNL
jgi:hypothetical protein